MDATGRYALLKLTPNASGSADITLRATDNAALPDDPTILFVEDTFHIVVAPVPDKPIAQADVYAATEDTTLTVDVANSVLLNDFDVDIDVIDQLSAVRVANPLHGTVTLNADGSFVYIPEADYCGADTFTYTILDDNAVTTARLSLPGVVTINITCVVDVNQEVILIVPLNNANLHDNNNVFFDWEDYAGAASYQIQISQSASFPPIASSLPIRRFSLLVPPAPIFNVSMTVVASNYTRTVPAGTVLNWRVRARKVSGAYSLWSEMRTLNTATPPSAPRLLAPVSKSMTYDYTPLLDWSQSAAAVNTVFDRYQIQVDNNADFLSNEINVDVPGILNHSFTPLTDLNSNSTYYWRVRSLNAAGDYSNWSSVFSFRTSMLMPVLLDPTAVETVASLRPVFDWSDVPGATKYAILIYRNVKTSVPFYIGSGLFGNTGIIVNVTTLDSTSNYTPLRYLPAKTTLFWRVKALGPNPSTWSIIESFITP
jgi:hypothetical protein